MKRIATSLMMVLVVSGFSASSYAALNQDYVETSGYNWLNCYLGLNPYSVPSSSNNMTCDWSNGQPFNGTATGTLGNILFPPATVYNLVRIQQRTVALPNDLCAKMQASPYTTYCWHLTRSNANIIFSSTGAQTDTDADAFIDTFDNCPSISNSDQLNTDGAADGGNACDTDDDNDLMPDVWETTYGLYPLVNDANDDADNDGISNWQEYSNGSNPTTVVTIKNDYNNDNIASWIWKGISNGNETLSQNWQLTFPLYSTNWGIPSRFYHPPFPDQTNWEIVTTGDFNKDGDADIVWRNTSTAQWKIWQMQDGTRIAQTTPVDFDLAHAWMVVGAGDTDKDGDDDVILNNTNNGAVLIWEMQNHAVTATHAVGTKSGYTLNRIGDFNKDGDTDLLFREIGTDVLVTWEIENNLFVQERALANTGTGYNPVCAADFDSDGDDDIMLINGTTQQEKWFEMQNYARIAQHFGSASTGFIFLGCGDYDGDADADTLWERSSDNMTRVVLVSNWGVTKQTVYTNPFGANGFVYRGNSN